MRTEIDFDNVSSLETRWASVGGRSTGNRTLTLSRFVGRSTEVSKYS
jgi:hypothetical protein